MNAPKQNEINFLKEQLKLLRYKQLRKQSEPANNVQTKIAVEAQETLVHDLSEEEKICACCHVQMSKIGENTAKKLEYIPATLKVTEHVWPKYSCHQCETIKPAKTG